MAMMAATCPASCQKCTPPVPEGENLNTCQKCGKGVNTWLLATCGVSAFLLECPTPLFAGRTVLGTHFWPRSLFTPQALIYSRPSPCCPPYEAVAS